MSLKVNILGINLGFSFEDKMLEKCLKEYLSVFEKKQTLPKHTFSVHRETILIDGKVVDSELPLAFPLLINRFFSWIKNLLLQEVNDYLLIHAGVVQKDGKAYIFPADGGGGKSTLVAWLFLKGCRVLSDELGLISLKDGLIYPYPLPIKLLNPPREVITSLLKNSDIIVEHFEFSEGILYYIRHKNPPLTGCEIGSFIFPRRTKTKKVCIRPLNKKELLLKLIPHCNNLYFQSREIYGFLFKLIEKVPGYELIYGGIEDLKGCSFLPTHEARNT